MMQIEKFRSHMQEQGLADKTVYMRERALIRIEKYEQLDLDEEFSSNGLQNLINRFQYTAADATAGRPNPTRMPINPGKALERLRWYRVHLGAYQSFLQETTEEDDEEVVDLEELDSSPIAVIAGNTFAFERHMQAALRANLSQLEPGLTAIDGGSERTVEGGRIDILAEDSEGRLVVIELKAGPSKPDAITQVLAYMASVRTEPSQKARGILIAASHPSRVELAAQEIPNLQLKTYRFSFQFE